MKKHRTLLPTPEDAPIGTMTESEIKDFISGKEKRLLAAVPVPIRKPIPKRPKKRFQRVQKPFWQRKPKKAKIRHRRTPERTIYTSKTVRVFSSAFETNRSRH
jgi:hypothetical protein